MTVLKRSRTIWFIVLAVIILLAVAPALVAVLASLIANANGCVISMASRDACMIAGADWTPTLLNWSLWPWFLFYSIPLGFLLLIVWLVAFFATRSRVG